MASSGTSASELITRAAAGDRTALSQLLLLHYDMLFHRISARITADLQGLIRAEDILQQTFIRAAQSIRSFEPRSDEAFRAWLRTIADNLLHDAHRRRRRESQRTAHHFPAAGRGSRDATASLDPLPADQTSPSRRARVRESVQRMKTALSRLPTEHREVIQRRYLDGESLEQIASRMGCSKETVRGLCYRARQRLRASMGRSSLYFSG